LECCSDGMVVSGRMGHCVGRRKPDEKNGSSVSLEGSAQAAGCEFRGSDRVGIRAAANMAWLADGAGSGLEIGKLNRIIDNG